MLQSFNISKLNLVFHVSFFHVSFFHISSSLTFISPITSHLVSLPLSSYLLPICSSLKLTSPPNILFLLSSPSFSCHLACRLTSFLVPLLILRFIFSPHSLLRSSHFRSSLVFSSLVFPLFSPFFSLLSF